LGTVGSWISLAYASWNPADPNRIGASGAFLKVLFGAHRGNFLTEGEGDQLIQSHALRCGGLAGLS
jgi:hypothetical protein